MDIKCILDGCKRKGWSALLPDQSPVGFAEISIRDYANGCRAQPVPFLDGIWVIKPYRRQGVVFALVKTIKRDCQAKGLTELYLSAYIKNTVSHSAHQSWGLDETDCVVFFEHRWFENAVATQKTSTANASSRLGGLRLLHVRQRFQNQFGTADMTAFRQDPAPRPGARL